LGSTDELQFSEQKKNMMQVATFFLAIFITGAALSQSPDISARRLLSAWKGDDASMRMVAEVIASAFAGVLSWNGSLAGKPIRRPTLRAGRS
jgi:hypothetical protein